MSGKQIFLTVKKEIAQLPPNWQLTQELCDPTYFSGILIIDGKYVAVKGFSAKIPFVYAIDYLTHDVIHGDVFTAEDEISFSLFFQKLKDIGYGITVVVADDRQGLKPALLKVFPYAKLQLCHNHYLENIRIALKVRSLPAYQHFFNSLRKHVFLDAKTDEDITQGLMHVKEQRTNGNKNLWGILYTIDQRRIDLFNYRTVPGCPNNTNLIELFNSHVNGRLESVKGFQSIASARAWFNAHMIRRRTLKFTDCDEPFKHLNKHTSLEFTIKKTAKWPTILTKLGIKPIQHFKSFRQIAAEEALER